MAYLYVKGATQQDANKLCVRIKEADKPDNIKWGDWAHISVNNKKVTCKIFGGQTRLYNIRINMHLRNILEIKINDFYEFRIDRASTLLMPFYIMKYHPNDTTRVQVGTAVIVGLITIIIGIVFSALPLLW